MCPLFFVIKTLVLTGQKWNDDYVIVFVVVEMCQHMCLTNHRKQPWEHSPTPARFSATSWRVLKFNSWNVSTKRVEESGNKSRTQDNCYRFSHRSVNPVNGKIAHWNNANQCLSGRKERCILRDLQIYDMLWEMVSCNVQYTQFQVRVKTYKKHRWTLEPIFW